MSAILQRQLGDWAQLAEWDRHSDDWLFPCCLNVYHRTKCQFEYFHVFLCHMQKLLPLSINIKILTAFDQSAKQNVFLQRRREAHLSGWVGSGKWSALVSGLQGHRVSFILSDRINFSFMFWHIAWKIFWREECKVFLHRGKMLKRYLFPHMISRKTREFCLNNIFYSFTGEKRPGRYTKAEKRRLRAKQIPIYPNPIDR